MAVAVRAPQEGDYLTDEERLLFVIKEVESEDGHPAWLVEDASLMTTRLLHRDEALRYRLVRKDNGSNG